MAKRYGISYMGSKSQIVKLIRYVMERHYDKKIFIDVFVGGMAVSDYVLQHSNMEVLANDLNEYIIALYEEMFINKSANLNKVIYDFVEKDLFNDVRDNPKRYPKWYVGYITTLWSFGNSQDSYMYGEKVVPLKRKLHNAIVNNIFTNFIPSQDIINIDYKKNPRKRIAYLKEYTTKYQHERVDHLQRIERLKNIKINNRIKFHNKDWFDFITNIPDDILDNAVIYCDPPYENTTKYAAGGNFDYNKFWNWFRNAKYAVYVSSYNAPSDIKPLNFEHKISLLGPSNSKIKKENIYWNGK